MKDNVEVLKLAVDTLGDNAIRQMSYYVVGLMWDAKLSAFGRACKSLRDAAVTQSSPLHGMLHTIGNALKAPDVVDRIRLLAFDSPENFARKLIDWLACEGETDILDDWATYVDNILLTSKEVALAECLGVPRKHVYQNERFYYVGSTPYWVLTCEERDNLVQQFPTTDIVKRIPPKALSSATGLAPQIFSRPDASAGMIAALVESTCGREGLLKQVRPKWVLGEEHQSYAYFIYKVENAN